MPAKRFGTRFFKKITPLAVWAGLFFCLVTACEGASAPSSDGDTFVIASIAEPSNLIPFLATDTASASVSSLLFNGLVKYDKDLKLVGDLAESWEVTEGGMVIVFNLRKGVRWQDGAPFTALDVEFTFKKLIDPAVPTPYGGDFQKVESLRVIDPWTVEVRYKEPFSPGLASWGMGIVPKHLLEGQDFMATPFARKPVGTGPYRLERWTGGQKLVLMANEDYFEGKPFIERYIYRVIPDQATTFLELQTENVDLSGLTPLQFKRQTDTAFFQERYRKYRLPSFGYAYIGWNLQDRRFSDKRVRRALGRAIHKKELIDVALLGHGRVATGPFLPGSWAHDPAIPETPFDPAEARRLLAEAGWADKNGDGILEKDGKKFSFTILTNQGNSERKMACEMIQKRFRDVGVDMRIQVVEWGTFLKEFIDKRRFEAVLLAWNLPMDPDIYDIFHSSKTKPGEFNFVSYRSVEVDRLLDEGRRIFPEEERAPVYRALHRILSEDEPYAFLYVPDSLTVVHARFRGVEAAPAGLRHNFIQWSVPESERRYRPARRA